MFWTAAVLSEKDRTVQLTCKVTLLLKQHSTATFRMQYSTEQNALTVSIYCLKVGFFIFQTNDSEKQIMEAMKQLSSREHSKYLF